MKYPQFLLASAAALGLVAAGSAQAATFVLNDTGGTAVGTQARAGFEIAAAYWSSVLTDNVRINLNIGFSALNPGVLGSTGSTRTLLSMNQTYNALNADRTSELDKIATSNLRPLGTSTFNPIFGGPAGSVTVTANNFNNGVNATNGYTDLSTRLDNDNGINNSTTAITQASAKALGITTNVNGVALNQNSSDGSITFSNLFAFDFDPTNGIDSNAFDFIGVAIHEIGHALGFVSGVDSYDARTSPGSTALGSLEGSVVASQLDLFRYGSEGNLDWSTQGVPYFSIDGGKSQLFGDSRLSMGVLNGDGRQASHFKDSPAGAPQLGILDPTSGRGQLQEVTALDLAAYDAIGWNVSFNVLANSGYRYTTADAYRAFATAVPEPATWGMMILGFGMVGASARYRRRGGKVAVA
jgi:hypothetical protein